jgi:hypothetical protein
MSGYTPGRSLKRGRKAKAQRPCCLPRPKRKCLQRSDPSRNTIIPYKIIYKEANIYIRREQHGPRISPQQRESRYPPRAGGPPSPSPLSPLPPRPPPPYHKVCPLAPRTPLHPRPSMATLESASARLLSLRGTCRHSSRPAPNSAARSLRGM